MFTRRIDASDHLTLRLIETDWNETAMIGIDCLKGDLLSLPRTNQQLNRSPTICVDWRDARAYWRRTTTPVAFVPSYVLFIGEGRIHCLSTTKLIIYFTSCSGLGESRAIHRDFVSLIKGGGIHQRRRARRWSLAETYSPWRLSSSTLPSFSLTPASLFSPLRPQSK